jgi:hypothetical protein
MLVVLSLVIMTEYRRNEQTSSDSKYEPFHGANFLSTWGVLLPIASFLYFRQLPVARLSASVGTTVSVAWVLVFAFTGSPNWDGENTLILDLAIVYLLYIPVCVGGLLRRVLVDNLNLSLSVQQRKFDYIVPLLVFVGAYTAVVTVHEAYSDYSTVGSEFEAYWPALLLASHVLLSLVHLAIYMAETKCVRRRQREIAATTRSQVALRMKNVHRRRGRDGRR